MASSAGCTRGEVRTNPATSPAAVPMKVSTIRPVAADLVPTDMMSIALIGYLEDFLAQVQRVPDGEPQRDRDPQAPPGEPDPRGQPERQQDARHHAGHPARRGAERLVDADLDDEQRRERRHDRPRRVGQQQRQQVGEDGGDGQADDGRGRGLGPVPDQGQGHGRTLRDAPRRGADLRGPVPGADRQAHGAGPRDDVPWPHDRDTAGTGRRPASPGQLDPRRRY